ncbi:hypothetical protein BN7_4761 [Wickerhamomyces ciferrii]|uniref:Uncharacterized protein n=1 Tax=Wickerhamomyces ciferrii (strain ATCC 14091 / BCRC 22168 / CBS 111 / JCM 3599 / NBRC 0793 / NRRL Y-1031 F-60-10) TaxID=1206466 RepID=K0KIY3_WICCF|nr:uncharacterized protein BN7_4761 [Wickerhamomyces ciferrii]CCH45180.1 hypothetical protein BN7_4761 [Wickerhamomyces ciferrii]
MMKFEKSGYIIEISVTLYVKPKDDAVYNAAKNLLFAKSPKHFKIDHETSNNFYEDKKNDKLISVFKEIPKPLKELTLNHKSIIIKWRRVNELSSVSEKTCNVLFYFIPGFGLKDFLIEILSDLIKKFQGDIPDFLNTEVFGNGLDMIEENKLLMNIFQYGNLQSDLLPLRIILESLITYLMSKEYEIRDSYDHIVKAYEFNYENQLKIMVIWGEKLTLKTYKTMLEQLNYIITNDVLSEPPNDSLIALIPGYLNYNINSNNDELPPSYGSSIMQ